MSTEPEIDLAMLATMATLPLEPAVDALKHGRLTVVDRVYYQNPDGATDMAETLFAKQSHSEEQVYKRGPIKLDGKWQPIDIGWFKPTDVGMAIIFNEEGKHPQRIPTVGEKAEQENRIIEIYIRNVHELKVGDDPPEIDDASTFILVPPKESQKLQVSNIRDVFIRARVPGMKVKYFVTPR